MQPASTTLPSKFRDLLPVALGLLLLVSLSSVVDLLFAGTPLHFDDIRWRYQIMQGVLSSATQAGLFVGLFLIIGVLADHRLTIRVAGVVAVALAVVYLIIVPFFALDFVVARRLIAVNVRHGFDMQAAKTVGYVVLLAVALLWSGIRGIRITPKPDASKPREVGEGLIVGQR